MGFCKKIMDLYKQFLMSQLRNPKNKKNVFFKSSTTKHLMNSYCTLQFSAETEKKKKEINERLKVLVKKYINTPEKLIQYMKLKGYTVYKFRGADKLLAQFGEEEGFLTPLKGYKALVLNFIIGVLFEQKIKIKFKTEEMFIFNVGATEIYTIARALHKHQGYTNNLPGFDYKSQETFKKVYKISKLQNVSPFATCSINDMYACKEAIARDLEAIKFTIELSVEYERSKKALNKLKETNSTKI